MATVTLQVPDELIQSIDRIRGPLSLQKVLEIMILIGYGNTITNQDEN